MAKKKTSFKKSFSKILKVLRIKNLSKFKIFHLKDLTANMYLIFALVIFAFFLGMLTNKVSDLQKQVNDMGSTSAAAPQSNPATSPAASTAPAGPVNVSVGNFPVLGDSNAKVTVIEFADFRCPFCEQWFQTVEPSLMSDYVNTGKVKF